MGDGLPKVAQAAKPGLELLLACRAQACCPVTYCCVSDMAPVTFAPPPLAQAKVNPGADCKGRLRSRRVETKLSFFDLMASMIRGKEQVLLSYCQDEYQVQAVWEALMLLWGCRIASSLVLIAAVQCFLKTLIIPFIGTTFFSSFVIGIPSYIFLNELSFSSAGPHHWSHRGDGVSGGQFESLRPV